MSSPLAAQAALLPGEKLKIIGDEEAAYCERNDGDPETLYTNFNLILRWRYI